MDKTTPGGQTTTSPATIEQRSRHPALHALLDKLHRRIALSEAEVTELQRHLEALEEHARREHEQDPIGTPALASDASDASLLPGHATAAGCRRLAGRREPGRNGFYRPGQDLVLSTVGAGTFRGPADDATDAAYAQAIHASLTLGVNVVDTAINYRHQRSERSVAAALRKFVGGGGRRDEVIVCTKGGFLVDGAITPGSLAADDIVAGTHVVAASFLADQLERSRRNLGLDTVDVYYVHNPETQLQAVGQSEFLRRMRRAFEFLETAVADGKIRYYGTATWRGYLDGILSLTELFDMARAIAGADHHFRFVQLPCNLGMQEAMARSSDRGPSVLELTSELGMSVVASASVLQARLARDLPAQIGALMPGLQSDAQRAIQFARSTPGIACALVGSHDIDHVVSNLAVAAIPPLTVAEHRQVRAAAFA